MFAVISDRFERGYETLGTFDTEDAAYAFMGTLYDSRACFVREI